MDDWANQHRFSSSIYLLTCLVLEFHVIIDRAVGSPGHGKDVIDGLNYRNKCMLKLSMVNLLNTKLIQDGPIVFKFMQFHENEEYQAVRLEK